ncbi:MAG: 50S ribosomal protein L15e [Euryarchaeota archaeon HGW-Euryarchaeota-1]|nr:MAG: 50S ribosomal protein L15e [Euryarchaeota archaeon HGW-Euryarchaeota-1]
MGLFAKLQAIWRKPNDAESELQRTRMIAWRKEGSVVRIEHPTKLHRARALGYKAKKGIVLVRVCEKSGGRRREYPTSGRKPKHAGLRKFTPKKSLQWIAEEKAARKYPNMSVLNSYLAGDDGIQKWYEVILVDSEAPEIATDKNLSWIGKGANTGRVSRGLTSAGKKSRGLRNKGRGAERLRPSLAANGNRGK